MTSPVQTFADASREVVARFLQSIVVIDDRADFLSAPTANEAPTRPNAPEPGVPSAGPSLTRTVRRLRPPAVLPAAGAYADGHELDAKAVIDRFADKGIVCAVIRPAVGEDTSTRTVSATRTADVVVLDWFLNGDPGEESLDLLEAILSADEKSDSNGRLRLFAIYTAEDDLAEIAKRVAARLTGHYRDKRLRRVGKYTLIKGPIRVAVFAKAAAKIPAHMRGLRKRVATYAELPDRLITEFSSMTSGLVSNVALVSLAALRANTHRILANLDPGLDPAYLWHRATQARAADAEDHLVELVAGELHSILETAKAGTAADLQRIRLWLEHPGAATEVADRFKSDRAPTLDDAIHLLEVGFSDGGRAKSDPVLAKFRVLTSDPPTDIRGFAPSIDKARQSNMRFATLMSLKTRYDNPPPRLTLGTIVSTGRGKTRKYWLCMQPRCDSVRLTGSNSFPLVRLEPVSGKKKFNVVLPTANGTCLYLKACLRPADVKTDEFTVSEGEDSVIAKVGPHGTFRFKSSKRRWYTFAGELKFEQAQRMAEKLGNEFSRMGFTESEWLRRWSPG